MVTPFDCPDIATTRVGRTGLLPWFPVSSFSLFWGSVCFPFCFPSLRNARLFIILFVCSFWRVCSQFWWSVRNSVGVPSIRNSRGNPSLCWLGGVKGHKNCEQNFVNKPAFPNSLLFPFASCFLISHRLPLSSLFHFLPFSAVFPVFVRY